MLARALLNSLAVLLSCCTIALAHQPAPRTIQVAPGQDYVPLLETLRPGDELVFLPGIHEGAAVLRTSGTAERPITIRGTPSDGRLPEIRFTGRGRNLWQIRASHLVIRDLAFHSTHSYGIRIFRAADITIENCLFRDNGGGDLSANSADVNGLRIRNSRFTGGRRTPVYIGHHDGAIHVEDFVFENNLVDGSAIEGDGIGYGIQLKLNVHGALVRHNYITGARGPGIMVYGSEKTEPGYANHVTGNIVVGSRRNPGIAVGGGPSIVRNNIVVGNNAGGISVFDYGGRGLLHHVALTGNIAAANRNFDFSASGSPGDFSATGNTAYSATGSTGYRNMDPADNRAAHADAKLLELAERLRHTLPDQRTLQTVWPAIAEPPSDQHQLTELLHRLLQSNRTSDIAAARSRCTDGQPVPIIQATAHAALRQNTEYVILVPPGSHLVPPPGPAGLPLTCPATGMALFWGR